MDSTGNIIYEFGQFKLDGRFRVLMQDAMPLPLTPKAIDTLLFLVKNHGRVITKEEFMEALWPDSFVEEGNLTQYIFLLRKALGDTQNGNSFIQTLPRKGYRFVAKVVETVHEAGQDGVLSPNYWHKNSPFRDLKPFEPEDAWLFFGRDPEIDALLTRLGNNPVLIVLGNSGSGKSSLIRAGLVSALQEGRFRDPELQSQWRIALFRPSAEPFDYLAEVLAAQLVPELSPSQSVECIASFRKSLPGGGDALRDAICALMNLEAAKIPARILLVADQFEEVFTLCSRNDVREKYIDSLLAAARVNAAVQVHLILVLRADFYPNCLQHEGLSRALQTNVFNLPRMPIGQLRETIERRLHLAGTRCEPGLVDSLLADVGSEPGNLALLEHALSELWEQCGGYGHTLTNDAYREIGRLRGALGRHADQVYRSCGDQTQKTLVQKIFLELVHLGPGAQDTRRRVSKSALLSLGEPGEVEPLLAHLISSRLIATGQEADETFVEVSHEALIREWPALREWISSNRAEIELGRRLLQATDEWARLAEDTGALLRGARLVQAEEWLVRHGEAPPSLRKFISSSVEARKQALAEARSGQERELAQQKKIAVLARRSATRLRWFSASLILLLVLTVAAAWLTRRQQLIAEAQALAAQSMQLLSRDHGQSLELALRSWSKAKTEDTHLAVAKAFPDVMAILRHDGPVTSATFSPDGQRIVSASDDNTARLWRAADGYLLATLKGHSGSVADAVFSGDGQRIVTASDDRTARVWDGFDGHLIATLDPHLPLEVSHHDPSAPHALFSSDGRMILSVGWDQLGRLWNSADGHLIATLRGHNARLSSAAFSPDGKHIVTAAVDGEVRMWGIEDNSEVTMQGHTAFVQSVAFFPDGSRFITASWDRTARIWNVSDGRLLAVLQHDGFATHAQPSPDGQRVVTSSGDHKARVWESSSGRLLFTLQLDGPAGQPVFSPDGRYILVAGEDNTARVWSSADGRLVAILEGHAKAVSSVAFSPNGDLIMTGSIDHTVRLWNTSTGLLLSTLFGSGAVSHAEFSNDGQRIVTTAKDNNARLWQADGRLIATLPGGDNEFMQAHFSPDGLRIVTASKDQTATVWDGINGQKLLTLQGHTGALWQAVFSSDGRHIVSASRDTTARVWNAADGSVLFALEGHTNDVYHAVFSPDGRRIVTASADHTARVWDSSTGRLLTVLQGHSEPVWRAFFSPDGRHIVTASFDHTARVWDSNDGHLESVLHHSDLVDAAEFSPDSQHILTASWDGTARLWSIDGREQATFKLHSDRLISAAFSPDGRFIATASKDYTAKVWNSADHRMLANLNHSSEVWQAAFSPDSRMLVTASLDQSARVWRIVTLNDIREILENDKK